MNERKNSGEEAWRIFCAVELPQTVRLRVEQHIARLREAVPDAKASWSHDANLHLTLKFIGQMPRTSVPNFSNAAARTVEGLRPFTIHLEQTGVFPKHGPPRVLWLGINDQEGNLAVLQARLEEKSVQAGIGAEARPFNPHLTIARLRQPLYARSLAAAHKEMQFESTEITVSEMLVIRSELSPEGSRYSVISRHAMDVSDKL